MELLPSRNYLDGMIGIRSGIAPGFWFDVFGGYKITNDEVFFVPSLLPPSLQGDIFANTSVAMQANAKHAFGGVNLKYSYQQLFDINLKGVYNSWNVNDIEDAYGKPEMELTAGVTVHPINPGNCFFGLLFSNWPQDVLRKTGR